MTQNYIVTVDKIGQKPKIVTISTRIFDLNDIADNMLLVSAGSVSFIINQLNHMEADVTHGSLSLGVAVDLEQMKLDKELLKKLFTN